MCLGWTGIWGAVRLMTLSQPELSTLHTGLGDSIKNSNFFLTRAPLVLHPKQNK